MGEHLVGDDDRERDRDQRLPQVLALIPAQEALLHDDSDDGDTGARSDGGHDPLPHGNLGAQQPEPGVRVVDQPLLQVIGDVAAEQVQRPVRHVHDPHQPEDEREAAGHDEEHAGERHRVEERRREVDRVVDGGPVGRLGRPEHDPDEREGSGPEHDCADEVLARSS